MWLGVVVILWVTGFTVEQVNLVLAITISGYKCAWSICLYWIINWCNLLLYILTSEDIESNIGVEAIWAVIFRKLLFWNQFTLSERHCPCWSTNRANSYQQLLWWPTLKPSNHTSLDNQGCLWCLRLHCHLWNILLSAGAGCIMYIMNVCLVEDDERQSLVVTFLVCCVTLSVKWTDF
jgi:hypothetical protein